MKKDGTMNLIDALVALGLSIEKPHEVAALKKLINLKVKNASIPPPKEEELEILNKVRKVLAEQTKDKVVIGPFTVAGLDERGGLTQAAIVASTVTEDLTIVLFKVCYSGEISEMEVMTFEELMENCIEDFMLGGKNFYFVCEIDD